MERLSALSRGMQLMLGGGVLLLIDTFLHWQSASASFAGLTVTASRNAWHGWGVLVGLLTIVLLVWLAVRVAATDIRLPVSDAMAGVALGALILLFTLLKVLVDNDYRTAWAWIGLVLAALIAAGAWLEVKAGGGMEALRTETSGMRTGAGGTGGQTSAPPTAPPQAPPPAAPADEDKAPGQGM